MMTNVSEFRQSVAVQVWAKKHGLCSTKGQSDGSGLPRSFRRSAGGNVTVPRARTSSPIAAAATASVLSVNSIPDSVPSTVGAAERVKACRLITAVKTPYLPSGRIDLNAFDTLVCHQIRNGVEVCAHAYYF